MALVERSQLAAVLAAMGSPVRILDVPGGIWRELLADVDAADALLAVIRLARRRRDITAGDIRGEARAIREERRTGRPGDCEPDGPWHYRTELPAAVTAMVSRRVSCPWCGAGPGQPCTLPGGHVPLRRTPVHPARVLAAGLEEPHVR
ncbi:zinc finger domain-containing protein [Pseudonocardia asaccharolytica]|uniref:DNA-binding phage zinc finger domain-containing protein n=1 Tax=Pseudonocardia asaccharolytica DSM 44247 = NBRC 16224 TaxID=1123024 RepID=A0A511D4R1_9PSEU|nr:hypothetical protein [Pseudonocardia asaccharolytica]GEL19453.1 hypothetical protein PA7_32900 [Pseudonocardia asaccharolytica DSM 44247 = NBRC 16224]